MKKVLLLGGGHAHVHVLRQLAREPWSQTQVALVSPHDRQIYSGMVPGWVSGHYQIEDCVIALKPLCEAARVVFVEDAATAIDAQAKLVRLSSGEVVPYDILSVDTGPVMDRDAIPGARAHALFLRPIEQFVSLFDGLLALSASRSLSVVVIGGGAAGVELVLSLQHRLGPFARLSLVTGGAVPLAGYPVAVQQRAMTVLRRARVAVLQQRCVEITADHVRLDNGARLNCDAPIAAWGSGAATWFSDSGLARDEAGFIQTLATLQSTSHPNVFAVGDAASRVDVTHPKNGVYAVRSGPPLFENLKRSLSGQALVNHQPQDKSLNLLACGDQFAIASWGDWSAQGRWVWWCKRWIDRRFIARYRFGRSSDAGDEKKDPPIQ